MTTETQSAPVAERGERTMLTGKVTSAKMEKTIVVEVQRLVQHPKYRRVVRISKKFYAHDENRQAKPGDTVSIVASRPLSKLKRWRVNVESTRHNAATETLGVKASNKCPTRLRVASIHNAPHRRTFRRAT